MGKESHTHYTDSDGEVKEYKFHKNDRPIWNINDFLNFVEEVTHESLKVNKKGEKVGKKLVGKVMTRPSDYRQYSYLLANLGNDYNGKVIYDIRDVSRSPTNQAVYYELDGNVDADGKGGGVNSIRNREIVTEITNNPSNYHYVWIKNDGYAHYVLHDFLAHYMLAGSPDNMTLNVEGIGGRGEKIFESYFEEDKKNMEPNPDKPWHLGNHLLKGIILDAGKPEMRIDLKSLVKSQGEMTWRDHEAERAEKRAKEEAKEAKSEKK